MNERKVISEHFKPYVHSKNAYKGGRPAPKGLKSYKLSSNENALGTSPKVKQIIHNSDNFNIYPDNTDEKLRIALSIHHDNILHPDQFICGNSGSEVLEMAIRAFINEGDEVILSNPCFLPYHTFSTRAGAKIVDVPLHGDQYQLDVDGIVRAISNRTRIIFLTSPNNPTGTIITSRQIDALLSQTPSDVLIVYDEVYYQYSDSEEYKTALTYVKKGHNILAINSFSKAFGMASLRLGYGYTTPEIANYLRLFQRPFLINKLTVAAGLAALSDKEFINITIKHNINQREYLESEFERLGINYTPTQGNFHLIHSPIPTNELVDTLYDQGVMVRDVGSFGAPGKVRITIGTDEGNRALVKALEKIL